MLSILPESTIRSIDKEPKNCLFNFKINLFALKVSDATLKK